MKNLYGTGKPRGPKVKKVSKRLSNARAWRAANPEKARAAIESYWATFAAATAKWRCRRRGLPYDIDAEHLRRLFEEQGGRCHWLGVPMVTTMNSHWKVSVERLDPMLGYVRGNVVLSTWFANRARGTMGAEEFRQALRTVAGLAHLG